MQSCNLASPCRTSPLSRSRQPVVSDVRQKYPREAAVQLDRLLSRIFDAATDYWLQLSKGTNAARCNASHQTRTTKAATIMPSPGKGKGRKEGKAKRQLTTPGLTNAPKWTITLEPKQLATPDATPRAGMVGYTGTF